MGISLSYYQPKHSILTLYLFGRGGSLLVNNPKITREILQDENGLFYKSDLLVSSVEDLGGKSLFISTGDKWARDKRMLIPAYNSIRSKKAFETIVNTVKDFKLPKSFSLDFMMYYLTSDVMYRLMFFKTNTLSCSTSNVYRLARIQRISIVKRYCGIHNKSSSCTKTTSNLPYILPPNP